MLGLIAWRSVLAVVVLWQAALLLRAGQPMWPWAHYPQMTYVFFERPWERISYTSLGLLLGLGLGLPSLLLAVAFWRRWLWVAWLALPLDLALIAATALPVGLHLYHSLTFQSDRFVLSYPLLFVALLSSLEAAYLLGEVRGRSVWRPLGFTLATIAIAWAAIAHTMPAIAKRHVRPLLRFVDTHIVRLPSNPRIELTRDLGRPHIDRCVVRTSDGVWLLNVEHGSDRRWHFDKNRPACSGVFRTASLFIPREVERFLRLHGAADSALQPIPPPQIRALSHYTEAPYYQWGFRRERGSVYIGVGLHEGPSSYANADLFNLDVGLYDVDIYLPHSLDVP
jgi:hypothetical protein